MNLHDQKAKILQATKQAPEGGDFVGDGVDEDDRPLSKQEMLEGMVNKVGRPKSPNPKHLISIRLSAEVVDYFRSTGKGWQTRMDEVLKKYIMSSR